MADNQYYGSISPTRLTGGTTLTTEQKRTKGQVLDWVNKAIRFVAGDGKAEIVVNKNNIVIASDENTAIGLSDGCIVLDGKISFTRKPDDIMISGFWRLNEELLLELPSTLATPISVLNFKYPSYIKKASKMINILTA